MKKTKKEIEKQIAMWEDCISDVLALPEEQKKGLMGVTKTFSAKISALEWVLGKEETTK